MSSLLQKIAPIGEARDREILKDAETYIYAERDEGPVTAHLFAPAKRIDDRPAPMVVFFHGGFWDTPMPTQFVPHCLHFASRGAVAVAAETRLWSKHRTGPLEAVEDARELIRCLRRNATALGADPERVIVGGAGGGAMLALLTAMPKPKQMPAAEDGVDCRPQALVLFSSLLNPTRKAEIVTRFPDARTAKRMSPLNLLRRKLPPMMLFHGKADRITPFADAAAFRRGMKWRGNPCELIDFEREDHMFFNFNVNHRYFELTVEAADDFLVRHNLLDAPEVPDPFSD
ncbi:MAG: alpha/beta hydrolase [Luteolibacter sp.]|jgi:acetyl esterase